jgi:hypothetical protein
LGGENLIKWGGGGGMGKKGLFSDVYFKVFIGGFIEVIFTSGI